ncbi:protein FAR1-RELATED SEQUENCE 12-like [Telopea speciosissima]|uniref:protein FAR1-RELATED SEQUENCE 12-like n=1 Tax=Telopea speciosissima TaxID=54955 RepID=UPI001CC3E8D0|nr:protein FAR1-RELATED SEQUENCE 12-like [Telopea speciosissima]
MDTDQLEGLYNAFIEGENNIMDQNETGSSDVFNDEMDSDSTSSQEENDSHNGNISMEDEENNSFQSNESDSYTTSSENDLVDEFNEEECLEDLGLDETVHKTLHSRVDNHAISRYYVYSNQGEKSLNDKRGRMDYKPRAIKKTNCKALMRIKFNNGVWTVDMYEKEHNHPLVDKNESFRLRSHKKNDRSTTELIQRLRKYGNLLRSERRNCVGVDCQQAINYLDNKRTSDAGFFYAVRVNEGQQLTGIFWVDSRARKQYKNFGDVIVFDTTYKKNKYKFPFAPFTGVNHHMQSTLFGCGLIADETKESFIWLFKTWLQAMLNIHPKAILTDEDPGIMKAIKQVFPLTGHRLCGWQLEKHRINHMRPLYKRYPDLKAVYRSCINDSKTPFDFEEIWDNMIQRYNLEDHKWLKKHFRICQHWVPCYYIDIFFAGHKIEHQASNVYTKKVFKVFSVEWFACFGLEASQCDDKITVMRYKVCSRDGDREIHVNYVLDNQEDEITICDCKMFEQKGILCKHILKIYVITDRSQIPHHYIMLRWIKGARYIESGLDEGSSKRQPQQPVWILHDIAHRLASEGSLSQERYNVAHRVLNDGLQEVLRLQAI